MTLLFRNFLIAIFCFAAFACNKLRSDDKYEFFYYPSKNVYYDVSNARYLYSLNGGRTWDTLYKRAGGDPATLGKKQIIYNRITTPWDSNEVHRKMYGGVLLDISNVDSSMSQQIVVTERKSAKKSAVVSTKTTKNPRKKNPGFSKGFLEKKH